MRSWNEPYLVISLVCVCPPFAMAFVRTKCGNEVYIGTDASVGPTFEMCDDREIHSSMYESFLGSRAEQDPTRCYVVTFFHKPATRADRFPEESCTAKLTAAARMPPHLFVFSLCATNT